MGRLGCGGSVWNEIQITSLLTQAVACYSSRGRVATRQA